MNQTQNQPHSEVVGQINLGGLVIDIVKPIPCYRASAIGKGIPQYCTCRACESRGDLGKTLVPRVVNGNWVVEELK